MFEEQSNPQPEQPHITQREMTVYQYETKPANALSYGLAGLLFGALFGFFIPGLIISGNDTAIPSFLASLSPTPTSLSEQISITVWIVYLGFFAYVCVFATIIYFITAGRSFMAAVGLIIFLAGPPFMILAFR